MLFAWEKLKMSFRNSFVKADSPSPSPHTTHCMWWGERAGKRRETKLLINS